MLKQKKSDSMARPIKETPILFGKDARQFEARMQEKRTESAEAKEKRLKNYALAMQMFEAGKDVVMTTRPMTLDDAYRILDK